PLALRAPFFGTRTPRLDPNSRAVLRWPRSRAAFRQARYGLSERGRRRIFLFDLELSRLARDGLLREPLLYLPYADLHFRPRAFPSALGWTLPLGALGICFSRGAPASLCSVERRTDLPMGRAPDSRTWPCLVLRSHAQSVFCRSPGTLRRRAPLLF